MTPYISLLIVFISVSANTTDFGSTLSGETTNAVLESTGTVSTESNMSTTSNVSAQTTGSVNTLQGSTGLVSTESNMSTTSGNDTTGFLTTLSGETTDADLVSTQLVTTVSKISTTSVSNTTEYLHGVSKIIIVGTLLGILVACFLIVILSGCCERRNSKRKSIGSMYARNNPLFKN